MVGQGCGQLETSPTVVLVGQELTALGHPGPWQGGKKGPQYPQDPATPC